MEAGELLARVGPTRWESRRGILAAPHTLTEFSTHLVVVDIVWMADSLLQAPRIVPSSQRLLASKLLVTPCAEGLAAARLWGDLSPSRGRLYIQGGRLWGDLSPRRLYIG